MKYLLFILVSVVSMAFCSEAMASVDCVGRYEFFSNENSIKEEVTLEKTFDIPNLQKYEGQIDEYHYAVDFNPKDKSYRVGIYFGPDYTRGTIATGKFTKGETAKLAIVDGASVYTILCNQ